MPVGYEVHHLNYDPFLCHERAVSETQVNKLVSFAPGQNLLNNNTFTSTAVSTGGACPILLLS